MDGPRAPFENELPGIVQFLDSHLRPKEDWSISSEYPIAFSSGNLGNIRIIRDDEKILSHALMRPLIIKSPVGLFKVAGIGSVVTSSDYRNQGLSSKILDSCLTAARDHGCDFAILWTNLFDFYRRLGFELAGSEISILFDRDLQFPTVGLKFMESNKVSPEAIHRLYNQHTISSLRNLDETRKYLAIPNTRVYTAWGSDGVLKAYAIEGKGADLNGYIHEWGGNVSALCPLFEHVRKVQNRPITVIAPSHSENLIRVLRDKKLKINEGFLGMIKILNAPSLFNKIKRHARNLGVDNFVLEQQNDQFYIGTRTGVFKTDSEKDIVRLLFGPQKASQIHNFDKASSEVLEAVLPLDMWVWGWDSV